MRYIVTGAAGFVGLELSRQLSDAKFEVSAVARENGKFLLRDFGLDCKGSREELARK